MFVVVPSLFSAVIVYEGITSCNCCRYDLPWTPTKYIPFYGGPDYHDYHHYVGGQSQSNFASVFTYCDYLYGTDKVTTKTHHTFCSNGIFASNCCFFTQRFFVYLAGIPLSKESPEAGTYYSFVH